MLTCVDPEDVMDVDYVAWQADHDAYGFSGQKLASTFLKGWMCCGARRPYISLQDLAQEVQRAVNALHARDTWHDLATL